MQSTGTQLHRLLLVDNDNDVSDRLLAVLAQEGYTVDRARDGQSGLHLGLTRPYDVMVIDRSAPVIDGLSLVRRLRRRAVTARALMITATQGVGELVDGLDAGADDYLVMPFEMPELAARLRALCRRPLDLADLVRIGAGHLDLTNRAVVLPDGERVDLSEREFELLRALARRPSLVHSRDELRRSVFEDAASASIVDTYVYYLRRKLGRSAVRTVRNLGYRLGEL
jgi:two-component system, OmpR family, response regulator QseB